MPVPPEPIKSPQVKLAELLRELEDPKTPYAKNNGWTCKDFDPKEVVSAVTSDIALDRLLPAIFARGDAYRHLAVASCPPGCENVAEEEWADQYFVNPEMDPSEIFEVPLEVRIMHASYESALEECMDDLHRDRVDTVQQRQRQRQREWRRDNLKGRVVSLLREWLRGVPNNNSLEDRAAESLALELFPKTIHANGTEGTALTISTTNDLYALLKETMGDGDPLEPARMAVVDALVPLMIGWEFVQDLRNGPESPRHMKLPGLLQAFERNPDDLWWHNEGNRYLKNVLPPTSSSSLVSIVALSTVVHSMAVHPKDNDNDTAQAKAESLAMEDLLEHCEFQHPLEVRWTLPAIKAMLLRWRILPNLSYCNEQDMKEIEMFLEDVQEHFELDVKEKSEETTAPTTVVEDKDGPTGIAFACRCQACSQLVSFLQNVKDRDQNDDDTWIIILSDSNLRSCLYESVDQQGFGYVTAALSGGNRVKLRRGKVSKQELRRKKTKLEAAVKVKAEGMKRQCAGMLEKHKRECPIGVPTKTKDLQLDVQDCLFLVANN